MSNSNIKKEKDLISRHFNFFKERLNNKIKLDKSIYHNDFIIVDLGYYQTDRIKFRSELRMYMQRHSRYGYYFGGVTKYIYRYEKDEDAYMIISSSNVYSFEPKDSSIDLIVLNEIVDVIEKNNLDFGIKPKKDIQLSIFDL